MIRVPGVSWEEGKSFVFSTYECLALTPGGVPGEAVVEEHNGRGALFVARGGVARRLEVGLGQRLDREVQVTGGLAEGDEVVVVGQAELVDGQAVEPYR